MQHRGRPEADLYLRADAGSRQLLREAKLLWHDADDGVRRTVERHASADDGRVGSETVAPEAAAQDDDL